MATIGENIRKYRKQKNLTQGQLGSLVVQSAQVISNYERDYTTPDLNTLQLISRVLGVSIDTLTLSSKKDTSIQSVDLADNNLTFTYKGKTISSEDMRVLRRFLQGITSKQ